MWIHAICERALQSSIDNDDGAWIDFVSITTFRSNNIIDVVVVVFGVVTIITINDEIITYGSMPAQHW